MGENYFFIIPTAGIVLIEELIKDAFTNNAIVSLTELVTFSVLHTVHEHSLASHDSIGYHCQCIHESMVMRRCREGNG